MSSCIIQDTNGQMKEKIEMDKDDHKESNHVKEDLNILCQADPVSNTINSFLLLDGSEELQVPNDKEFLDKLSCYDNCNVKVVSIIGNTGDGKSYTLNQTFFDGQQVFATSADQDSCTIGVWAALCRPLRTIILDTEGMLGCKSDENQRMRLLMKVLAISDVVIYRTRSHRLHRDMYKFIGHASKSYLRYFASELEQITNRCHLKGSVSTLGPAVIIFHDTRNTDLLGYGNSKTANEKLREAFLDVGCMPQAFSNIEYVGSKCAGPEDNPDFLKLRNAIQSHLENNSIRSPRCGQVIYKTLKALNEKFGGEIEYTVPDTFPDAYFTCNSTCLSCGTRCDMTMNHIKDDIPHSSSNKHCKFQHQFMNKVYLCLVCHERGEDMIVEPKLIESAESKWLGYAQYLWSGYILECPNCGIIYRSRQYWYGNKAPAEEAKVIRTEIRHVWPGSEISKADYGNTARRLLDSLSNIADSVREASAKPKKIVSDWVADSIAPSYWVPNSEINCCKACQCSISGDNKIHHCRCCGEGFCDDCSANEMPVPWRGWGQIPVRVCQSCFSSYKDLNHSISKKNDETQSIPRNDTVVNGKHDKSKGLTARKVGEGVASVIGAITNAMEYPRGYVVDIVRPEYWVPDQDIRQCNQCQIIFGSNMTKHHCRKCGHGFCDTCTKTKLSVPSRGWEYPVRVCDNCAKILQSENV
ncbi:Zinc finger FYVE domain-containing protein 1 [Trichoplax sp. H2]|nr:Zinc finger FYVE domain-containing protein 1 [Trichoplax sp. H2]|eukprot:RDD40267.1 Zinc finger FYVE domain-containing protein 1 [Trichoplax sp. H2]